MNRSVRSHTVLAALVPAVSPIFIQTFPSTA